MKSDVCNSAALEISTKNPVTCTLPTTHTSGQSSKFQWVRMSSVLIETAITVAEVSVRRARNQSEYEAAVEQLNDLRRQVVSPVDRDNEIQDRLHERMDAQRSHGGETLEQFLAGGR